MSFILWQFFAKIRFKSNSNISPCLQYRNILNDNTRNGVYHQILANMQPCSIGLHYWTGRHEEENRYLHKLTMIPQMDQYLLSFSQNMMIKRTFKWKCIHSNITEHILEYWLVWLMVTCLTFLLFLASYCVDTFLIMCLKLYSIQ